MCGKYPKLIEQYGYKENQGLGYALQKGILKCKYEYVARMDSDDIAKKERFEKQMNYLERHPEIDILGGYLQEYDKKMTRKIGIRKVPLTNQEIYKNLGKQCPFNHTTVILKKEAVIKAGNYQKGEIEDYKLWVEMCKQNCKMENLPEVFTNDRIGKENYKRRSGIRYVKNIKQVEDLLLKYKYINKVQYIKNMIIRFIVAIMPITMKQIIYPKVIRKC